MKPMLSVLESCMAMSAAFRENGSEWPTEGQWHFNKISRSIIRAVKREHGEAWIYAPNGFSGDRHKVVMEYRKGMVFNFTGSFVMFLYDEEVVELMRLRLAAPYTSTAADIKRIDEIYDRAGALGCISLMWV